MLKLAFTGGAPTSLHEVEVAFRRRKELLAVLIGVALAGVPMGAFHL